MTTFVQGSCDPRFVSVRDAFLENFAARGEKGASVSVFHRGEMVVDLWGGTSDHDELQPWERDTIANFYSAGKPIIATLLLRRLEMEGVSLDEPIISVWPEFAARGKQSTTFRHALCHQAGVPAIRANLTNDDLWQWDVMTNALADSAPWFVAGTRHVYHTNTYGHLIGECLRRLSGVSPHDELERVSSMINADLHYGVGDRDLFRCANIHLDTAASPATLPTDDGGESSMILRGYFNPPGYSSFGVVNTKEWRQAQIPSTNGHGSGRGIASFYNALLSPDRLLSHDALAEAVRAQSTGPCPVLGEDVTFGLGFQPTTPRRSFGPHAGSFGHFGTGGALGMADPHSEIAIGYVMNHVIPRWQSTRNRALIDAVYAVVS